NTSEAHSWMLAIYQANPRAFEQNMNVLRTGAVLRIPENSAVAAVSSSEAASEIRRQYAAWRGGPGGETASTSKQSGQLHLVTPSDESAGSGTAAAANAAEVKSLQSRVHDLEGQLGESKRLLEMRNAELADLQSKLAAKGGAAAPARAAPPAPAQAEPPAQGPPVAKAEPPAAATPPPPAAEPPAQQTAQSTPPPAAEPTPAPSGPVHRPKPVQAQQPTSGPSFLDSLMEYWWALAAIVALVAAYFGFKTWRSRRQSEFDDSLSRLAVAGASSAERGFAAGDTAPMRPVS